MKKLFQKKYVSIVSVVIVGVILGLVIQFASAWTPPPAGIDAPGGNVAAPITTGAEAQKKKGPIYFGGFRMSGFASTFQPPTCLCDVDSDVLDCQEKSLISDFTSDVNGAESFSCYDRVTFGGNEYSYKYSFASTLTSFSSEGIKFSDGTKQKTAPNTTALQTKTKNLIDYNLAMQNLFIHPQAGGGTTVKEYVGPEKHLGADNDNLYGEFDSWFIEGFATQGDAGKWRNACQPGMIGIKWDYHRSGGIGGANCLGEEEKAGNHCVRMIICDLETYLKQTY